MLDRQYIKEKSEIDIICEFLRQKGFDEITPTQEINKYDIFDIYAKKDGYDYVIETKARSYKHNEFGDIFVEKLKIEEYKRRLEKNKNLRGLVFNLYSDNVIACNFITNYFREKTFLGPKTTSFENNEYVEKIGLLYKQKGLYSFEYDEKMMNINFRRLRDE